MGLLVCGRDTQMDGSRNGMLRLVAGDCTRLNFEKKERARMGTEEETRRGKVVQKR